MKSGWTDSKRKVRGCKESGDKIWILKSLIERERGETPERGFIKKWSMGRN